MMLTSQAQKTVLAISSYFINLLYNTHNAYFKTLRLKAYTDALKKYLYGILDYTEVEFFIFPCFEKLASTAHIRNWDPTVFRWFIAMPVD